MITYGRITRSPYSQKGAKLCGLRNSDDSDRGCGQVSLSEKVSCLQKRKSSTELGTKVESIILMGDLLYNFQIYLLFQARL
jgi:hypothetical protein